MLELVISEQPTYTHELESHNSFLMVEYAMLEKLSQQGVDVFPEGGLEFGEEHETFREFENNVQLSAIKGAVGSIFRLCAEAEDLLETAPLVEVGDDLVEELPFALPHPLPRQCCDELVHHCYYHIFGGVFALFEQRGQHFGGRRNTLMNDNRLKGCQDSPHLVFSFADSLLIDINEGIGPMYCAGNSFLTEVKLLLDFFELLREDAGLMQDIDD
jgi:hypothetical protein